MNILIDYIDAKNQKYIYSEIKNLSVAPNISLVYASSLFIITLNYYLIENISIIN